MRKSKQDVWHEAMDETLTIRYLSPKEDPTPPVTAESLQQAITAPFQETKTEALKPKETPENDKELTYFLIKKWEQCKLEAYQDVVGIWTIGWGHTKGVQPGDTCTQEQADKWLQEDLYWCHQALNAGVQVPLSHNQREALLSFIYNVGGPAFLKSTLLKRLNEGDYLDAANELLKWNKAGGRVVRGLSNRRRDERTIFLQET
jgi:lysozyme